ncbi:MAG TPA: beta-N-acetylglucosaminidase domain-containing protein [Usitatibacteraceae bacterium]|nr:beta-N-acetylglucosaminidase domain-containing protein [Usitatibacteraceae bacterium]
MTPELGVIEGYFGDPWSHADRLDVVARLAPLGFGFFHHAPKADAFLRRRWREPHPDAAAAELAALSAHCRRNGLRFGVGLSPYELYRDLTAAAKADFLAKLRALDAIGLDDLAILFDDTRGDVPDLAAKEAEIVHEAMAATRATRVLMCPTYYSDDRMLDVVFGERPAGYLEDLGRRLDPRVGVYWTGEEICAREICAGHLERVAGSLRRKPVLWDNYPVNDGPRMSRYLHLRAFTGRTGGIGDCVAAHAINPALQPHLTLIPAATLAIAYREGHGYCYMRAFRKAARELAGPALAAMLEEDLLRLQDLGIDHLAAERDRLRDRYRAIEHPMAAEVVRWLDGAYTVDRWEGAAP